LQYWVEQNKEEPTHHFNGKVWHYDSLANLSKIYAGVFSGRQVKAALLSLVKEGVLLRRLYKENDQRDPRRWYALADTENCPSGEVKSVGVQASAAKSRDEVQKGPINGRERAIQRAQKDKSFLCNPPYASSVRECSPQKLNPATDMTLCKGPSDLRRIVFKAELNNRQQLQPQQTFQQSSSANQRGNSLGIFNPANVSDYASIRQTYRKVHQGVFGVPPSESLGKAKFVRKCAAHLKLSPRCFMLIRMLAWQCTHPGERFHAKAMTSRSAFFCVQRWTEALAVKFATADETSARILFRKTLHGSS
jgi:hypothetical protein